MMSFVCLSVIQLTSFIVLLAVAIGIVFICGSLNRKISQRNIISNNKLEEVNLDAEDNEVKVEGVSLLAKRKYIVSEQNKIKPMSYVLVDKDNAVLLVNNIKLVYKNGDVIQFKDGDTVSSMDENIMLSC